MANFFEPIERGAPANAETFNAPMEELDGQVYENYRGIANNKAALDSVTEIVEELAADSTIQDQQIEYLLEHVETAEGKIENLEEAAGNLSGRMDGAERRLDLVEEDIDDAMHDISDLDGRVAVLEQDPGYELPAASQVSLGGVKVGVNLSIEQDGTLNAQDTTYGPATQQSDGLMSAADKGKLDGVEAGANAYSLPAAGANSLGGVKVGSGLSIDANGVLSYSGGVNVPIYFAVSDTAADIRDKAVSIPGITSYVDGMVIMLLLNNGNNVLDATMNFNINNLGAKGSNVNVTASTKMFFILSYDAQRDIFWTISTRTAREANILTTDAVYVTSETDAALDSLVRNKPYSVNINGSWHKLDNIINSNFYNEQYLYLRPTTITPGQQCPPIIKYRCRLKSNGVWDNWTEWTQI